MPDAASAVITVLSVSDSSEGQRRLRRLCTPEGLSGRVGSFPNPREAVDHSIKHHHSIQRTPGYSNPVARAARP